MTNPERSKAILATYKADSAWDLMLEFQTMSELERSLLSVQFHLADSMCADSPIERRVELEHAWHELSQVMHTLAEERNSGI